MTSRSLAACLVFAVVVGLSGEAQAQTQKRSGSLRGARKDRVASSPGGGGPVAPVDEAATAVPDGTGSADPFDVAAKVAADRVGPTGTPRTSSGSRGDETGTAPGKTEKATFGAGCFWHVEAAFEWLPGVKSAVSGYSGGMVRNPSYEEVHEGATGHAEVVQVEYDPAVISYEQLLKVFWTHHDPTQWNRQGPDIGTQYRSVIFYHTEAQRRAALKSYRELTAARAFPAPIVTQLLPMRVFYRAEDYHQNYYGGKDEPRVARSSRSRRARKPATPGKGTAAVAAGPNSTKAAVPSAGKGRDDKGGSPPRPGSSPRAPESGGDSEP
jgi:peptide-methionine (S)-S-oxide reductase